MIKQSFLDSLANLSLDEAKRLVSVAGHQIYVIAAGVRAIPMIARPNTVILWNDGTKVTRANAGDGLEIEHD